MRQSPLPSYTCLQTFLEDLESTKTHRNERTERVDEEEPVEF
jgi:hypothetical protein